MNILGVFASIFITIAYVVAIRELTTTKRATKEQMTFWLFITTGLLFATANSIQVLINTGVWGFFLIELVNVLLAIVSWALAYKYYRERNNEIAWYQERYAEWLKKNNAEKRSKE